MDGVRIFVRVVQAGSFSGAARSLGMPKSTVSSKVAELERRLGVTLIRRTTRKLHVTEAGELYFRRAVIALQELQAAEREVTSIHEEPAGVLRITAATDVGRSLLAPMVADFLKAHPRMKLDLLVTNRVVDLVGEGVDVGIRAGDLEDSSLISKKLNSAEMILVAAPSFVKRNPPPKSPSALGTDSVLRFAEFGDSVELERKSGGRRGGRMKLRTGGRISADDLETLQGLALLGEGIALLPRFLCRAELKAGKLIQLYPDWSSGSGTFTLVYPAQRFVPVKVRAFVDSAVRTVARLGVE
jgi:DNA-binding transcriptional LysR family regulator